MLSEEEIELKIKELDKEIDKKINEKYKLQEKHFKLYELENLKNKFLNRYFVYRDNSYSCPEKKEDYWNVYYKVIDVDKNGAIKAIETQKDKYGRIESLITTMSPNLEEISEQEYIKETSKILGIFEERLKI